MKRQYTLDNAKLTLQIIHNVSYWLIQHWDELPDMLYEKINDKFVPFDIKRKLTLLIQHDLANTLTPMNMWKAIAKEEGLENIGPTEIDELDTKANEKP